MMVRLRRYWVQLTVDKRKFSILCAGVGIALLLWARLIVVSNIPRSAVANPESAQQVQTQIAPVADIKGVLPAKPDNDEPEVVRITLDDRASRDPFAISVRYFPKPLPPPDIETDQGKFEAQPVENPEEIEARFVARLKARVQELTLEGCMSSASMAVISGQTVRVGDRIKTPGADSITLTIVEVSQRSVMLDFEGRQFELKMGHPGG